MGFAEYDRYDATGLAQLVRRREVTPLELVDEYLRALEAVGVLKLVATLPTK